MKALHRMDRYRKEVLQLSTWKHGINVQYLYDTSFTIFQLFYGQGVVRVLYFWGGLIRQSIFFSYIFQTIRVYLPLVAGRQPDGKRPLTQALTYWLVTKKPLWGYLTWTLGSGESSIYSSATVNLENRKEKYRERRRGTHCNPVFFKFFPKITEKLSVFFKKLKVHSLKKI